MSGVPEEADTISQIKPDSDNGSNLETKNKRKEKVSHRTSGSLQQNCGDSSINTSSLPVGIQLMERNYDVAPSLKNDLSGTSTNGSTMPNLVAVDMVRKTDCRDSIPLMDLELLSISPIDASDKNLSVSPVGSRDGVLRQASDSFLSEDPSLELDKTPDKRSPIRGVAMQLASVDLLDREDNQLESLKAGEASFSFQPGSGVTPVNGSTKKKLLVLDLNGILTDIVSDFRVRHHVHKAHTRVGGKAVFKRPFCDDFLKFCFERFDIGIWSSRKMCNVTRVVDYLMADTKHKLLFSWDQSRCTVTGFKTMENSHKWLVLKELKRIWNKEEPDLPWEKGEYSPSNTLLVDDSPYKALRNPPYTAIFPKPFSFRDDNDNSLGPGGDLRVYLEGLAGADDVEKYVQAHPFGQNAITSSDPSWEFYLKVIQSASARLRC